MFLNIFEVRIKTYQDTGMARVKNLDQITGSLKNLSFYTRKGSDTIFVRTKGGASKEKIKRDPAFEGLRRVNREFGGCAKMSKQIRRAFYGLEHVAEINLAARLSKLAKDVQKADTLHQVGERDIKLSDYRYLLQGYDFGRNTRFNTLLRVPLSCSIDRDSQQATVRIPAFACSFGLNLTAHNTYTQFRITASLGIVTNMALNPANQTYEPVHDTLGQGFKTCSTAWLSTRGTVQDQTLRLAIANVGAPMLTNTDTMLLTVILEFGAPDALGSIMPVRGVGAGTILGVG